MFNRAIIKLTAFYILIIVIIIGVFSLVLFHYTAQHIRDNVEEDSPYTQIQENIAEKTIDDFQHTLIIADLAVILLASLLSYFLAKKTLDPIQTALQAQEQFSANASHELRTPLSVMKSENEVFLNGKNVSAENAQELVISNLEEINKMSSMVENLLLLARSKKIKIGDEFRIINISKILDSVIKHFESIGKAKGINIIVEKPQTLNILGNEKLIEESFFNLIQNAINYSNKGSIRIEGKAEEKVVIKIVDSGIGIDGKDLLHIFKPFYKADKSRNNSGGVGLGLSIVKEILDKHQGKIAIESEINKGTTITITFPAV